MNEIEKEKNESDTNLKSKENTSDDSAINNKEKIVEEKTEEAVEAIETTQEQVEEAKLPEQTKEEITTELSPLEQVLPEEAASEDVLLEQQPEEKPTEKTSTEEIVSETQLKADETSQDEPLKEKREPHKNWYVIHTYSGYEDKVRGNLLKRIESMGMRDKIFQVLVPTEEEIEFRDSKRRTVRKKIYPGYVLVQMIMSDDSWYVVRNTQGVTGFVGPGVKPLPIQEEEIKQILRIMGLEAPLKIKIALEKGQGIRVRSGPFRDFTGIVDEIYPEKEKVRVLIHIFGRETPVELDFGQIEKL